MNLFYRFQIFFKSLRSIIIVPENFPRLKIIVSSHQNFFLVPRTSHDPSKKFFKSLNSKIRIFFLVSHASILISKLFPIGLLSGPSPGPRLRLKEFPKFLRPRGHWCRILIVKSLTPRSFLFNFSEALKTFFKNVSKFFPSPLGPLSSFQNSSEGSQAPILILKLIQNMLELDSSCPNCCRIQSGPDNDRPRS
jgi:hypothetical protein